MTDLPDVGGAPPGTPSAVEIFDTTLRDGAQFEGISLSVEGQAPGGRATRLARRALDRGRLPPGEPEGRGVLPPGPHRVEAFDRAAGGVRFDPSSRGQGRRGPHAAGAGRVRRAHGVHRGQELRLPRDRSTADHPRRGRGHGVGLREVPGGIRHAGVLRRRALLRRLQAQSRVRTAGPGGCGHQRRVVPRAVRHQRRFAARTRSSASWPRWSRTSTACRSGSTPRTTPAAQWPTRSRRSWRAQPRYREPSTVTASARATPT